MFYSSKLTTIMRKKKLLLIQCFALLIVFSLPCEENTNQSKLFLGFGTEFFTGLNSPEFFSPTELGLTMTLGQKDIFPVIPLRARAGISWWPQNDFCFMGGLEVAFLEKRNEANARAFGLYGIVDEVLSLNSEGAGWDTQFSMRGMFPISMIGGIALGVGYGTSSGFFVTLSYMTGAYVSVSRYGS